MNVWPDGPARRLLLGARAVAAGQYRDTVEVCLGQTGYRVQPGHRIRVEIASSCYPFFELHPGTGEPVGPDDLAPLFPMALIMQEVSQEAEIAIPEAILEMYSLWRPTPLYRARRLEQAAAGAAERGVELHRDDELALAQRPKG